MSHVRAQKVQVTELPGAPIPSISTVELTADQAPLLQRFFDKNPAYFLATSGEPAGPGEGLEEITSALPSGWSFTKKWVIGYVDHEEELVAMANVITDLLAVSVFHVGTFIVATERHGNGDARALYGGLEGWALRKGASWMRLGVVQGNERAERFWKSRGYLPVRARPGIQMGARVVTVQNMVKPPRGQNLESYFSLVARDRPEPSAEF